MLSRLPVSYFRQELNDRAFSWESCQIVYQILCQPMSAPPPDRVSTLFIGVFVLDGDRFPTCRAGLAVWPDHHPGCGPLFWGCTWAWSAWAIQVRLGPSRPEYHPPPQFPCLVEVSSLEVPISETGHCPNTTSSDDISKRGPPARNGSTAVTRLVFFFSCLRYDRHINKNPRMAMFQNFRVLMRKRASWGKKIIILKKRIKI